MYGEYLLGAHEYQSFLSILNPEICPLGDFFKFMLVEWKTEFYDITKEESEQLKNYTKDLK